MVIAGGGGGRKGWQLLGVAWGWKEGVVIAGRGGGGGGVRDTLPLMEKAK